MPAPKRIGLVTGVKAEQDALLPDHPRTSEAITSLTSNLTINRITAGGHTFYCCTPGIGKVNAALAAATLGSRFDIDLLAIIGTAGKIDPTASGGAHLLHEAVQADYGAYRDGRFVHYRAGELPLGPADDAPFVSALAATMLIATPDLPHARIATGDSFVEDAERSNALAQATGASLVDMETAAIAQVAERLGIDWLAVKAVSDDANQDSATDFAQQLAVASRQAADLFQQLLGI